MTYKYQGIKFKCNTCGREETIEESFGEQESGLELWVLKHPDKYICHKCFYEKHKHEKEWQLILDAMKQKKG